MTGYQRIFGSGPRGAILSVALLIFTWIIKNDIGLPSITSSISIRIFITSLMCLLSLALIIWSLKSLPPAQRGKSLCVQGVFKYFRHPLYAAFLTFFHFGLAFWLNNWIYILWAILLHPFWHWNIKAEEALMLNQFPGEYEEYAKQTGRFFPRFFKG